MIAILIFHILVALGSIGFAGWALVKPSKQKLRLTLDLTALTIVSGSYLIIAQPSHMTQTCSEGLVYLGLMLAGIFVIRHKLAAQKI